MQDNDHFSDSEYDLCDTKNEPHHNEAERDLIDEIGEVELADEIAMLEQEIRPLKAKVVGIEELLVPVQEDVKAIGQETLEAMTDLRDGITKTDIALCRAIDLVQELDAQLGETKEKVAHLEDTMGELNLTEVAEDVCQLLETTKNTEGEMIILKANVDGLDRKVTDDFGRVANLCEDVDALNVQMTEFDLVEVVANIYARFHDVWQKVRRVEKQVDEMTGLWEKVASQTAKISAQGEKIFALERKLDRIASYFDSKVDAFEEEVSYIPKIWSRLIDLDDYTNIEQCARNTQVTDDTVRQHRDEMATLEDKLAKLAKSQKQTSCAIQKANTTADTNFDNFTKKIISLDENIGELADSQKDAANSIELHVMKAVHREISSLDEKLGQFAEGYDRSVKDCNTRFAQVYERLSEQQGSRPAL